MVPVYVFLGFLESGKTSFIQETLCDENFNTGEKTLLLLCEEGVEEYEPDKFSGHNVHLVTIDSPDELTPDRLLAESRKIAADRVIVEYNGMWEIQKLAEAFPKQWQLFQTVMTVDSTTFQAYLKNMRQLMVDKIQTTEMVVFNRCTEQTDRAYLHRSIRMLSRRAQMMYEYTDGSVAGDDIEDELPFDINADTIVLDDRDYGIWYLDASDDPKKYDGKTIKFKAMACQTKKVAKDQFVPGRFCMTCCAEDITFIGFICELNGHKMPEHRSWVDITAKISIRRHKIYEGEGPWLTLTDINYSAEAPAEELVYLT